MIDTILSEKKFFFLNFEYSLILKLYFKENSLAVKRYNFLIFFYLDSLQD